MLRQVTAEDEVTGELEAALPQVFGEDGLAPHTPYDWRAERDGWEDERRRRVRDGPRPPGWMDPSEDQEDD